MKKITLSRICGCGLSGLLSFVVLLGTNNRVLTEEIQEFSIPENSVPPNSVPPNSVPYNSVPPNSVSPHSTSPNSLSAGMIWPTQGVISQGFRKRFHEGIDIAGPVGTPIFAAASGVVIHSGWEDTGLGNAVNIRHPDGRITVYGHTQKVLVRTGQKVEQGQMIAKMGSTGNSSGPHLHFEIYPNGRLAADPTRFLPPLIAGRIPPQKIAASPTYGRRYDPGSGGTSSFMGRRHVSPSQSMSVPGDFPKQEYSPDNFDAEPPEPVNAECSGKTVLEGETVSVHVKVCYEDGQLFYIGQKKEYPGSPIKIPARQIGGQTYQANNGSFWYRVSPQKVEVWQDGNPYPIRSDRFDRPNVSGG
ncbi:MULTISPECIES: M23 family metallopeptidase [Nostocales]|uniref:Peptidoglycan DD-metalloendopeptidase family protein n=3 Tax=Nostocales TaxID=1161 RepID=A0A0C1QW58_9CYAN|nr:M23 family metallopeptidase [Tolypothrix bouteillei]KAF3884572.1 peptidoglycan DD-metalloendopeptidase family protein [Tolypothrix bouteillei VB521301]